MSTLARARCSPLGPRQLKDRPPKPPWAFGATYGRSLRPYAQPRDTARCEGCVSDLGSRASSNSGQRRVHHHMILSTICMSATWRKASLHQTPVTLLHHMLQHAALRDAKYPNRPESMLKWNVFLPSSAVANKEYRQSLSPHSCFSRTWLSTSLYQECPTLLSLRPLSVCIAR